MGEVCPAAEEATCGFCAPGKGDKTWPVLKGVHFEIKGLCASARPGVAFRRLCSQSVVLEGVWGGGVFLWPTHKPFTWGPGMIFPRPGWHCRCCPQLDRWCQSPSAIPALIFMLRILGDGLAAGPLCFNKLENLTDLVSVFHVASLWSYENVHTVYSFSIYSFLATKYFERVPPLNLYSFFSFFFKLKVMIFLYMMKLMSTEISVILAINIIF